MNIAQIKALLILGACGMLALILGYSVATEEYEMLAMFGYILVALGVLLFAENIPLIAFGLVSPLILPIPFIWSFPFFLLILGICTFKLILQRTLALEKPPEAKTKALIWPFGAFFACVLFRYLLNPALPNFAGYGDNVTGFRSYLAYFMCFYAVMVLGVFLRKRENVFSLVRWMVGISIGFSVVLIACVFSKNISLARIFYIFGMGTSTFDNGLLRFVALPSFGVLLLSVSLLPRLLPMSTGVRIVLLTLGAAAVVLGGNRAGLAISLAMVICIPLAQGKFMQTGVLVFGISCSLLIVSLIGSQVKGQVGLLRVFALVSEDLAQNSGASDSVRWRQIRWERAWADIQEKPLIGYGYGGLENAFTGNDRSNSDEATVEIDLASGGIHNGYLACAHAMGIPAALLFIAVFGWQIVVNFRNAVRLKKRDPQMSQLHSFVFANMVGLAIAIYVGTDLNAAIIWFYLALGVLLPQIRIQEAEEEAHLAAQPAALQPVLAS